MEITINTGIPQDQVTKIVHEKGPGHTYVETIYPNGLVINYDMLPDGTVCSVTIDVRLLEVKKKIL